jgi:hypothetical protein
MAATAIMLCDLFHGEKRNKREAPPRRTGFPRASHVPGACASSATSRLSARSRARYSLFGAQNSLIRISQGIDQHALVIAAEYRGAWRQNEPKGAGFCEIP